MMRRVTRCVCLAASRALTWTAGVVLRAAGAAGDLAADVASLLAVGATLCDVAAHEAGGEP